MFSEKLYGMAWYAWLSFIMLLAVSCASERRLSEIRLGRMRPDLSMPSDKDFEKEKEKMMREIKVDSLSGDMSDGPLIMNAIKDEKTGEMVATDVIAESRVVARFRNVAERFGRISLEFDITVPSGLLSSSWKLELLPLMKMLGDSTRLDPVCITGQKYRDEQMRGYRRYERFLRSIIGDSSDFVRIGQLEIFIRRHFPETYAMRTDSSFVPEPVAENVFGVSRKEALEHYTRHHLYNRNERRKADRDRMFRKYVKDPLVSSGPRLDTVIAGADGDMTYRYVQLVDSRPGLRKIEVSLDGSLYEGGEAICTVERPEDIVFYVSSLSSLADMTPRYVMKVVERRVYDNTHAFIDFAQGRADLDTLLPGNVAELTRIRECVEGIVARTEFELDSLTVTASCSPEGAYAYNAGLSLARAETMKDFVGTMLDSDSRKKLRTGSIPENWDQFRRLVDSDTTLSRSAKDRILEAADHDDKDIAEAGLLAAMPEYRYLREKIYPRLRSVRFDFYLHRKGLDRDTVHTTVIDTVYARGVQALKDLDYKKAVELLRPYHDYNTALAYLSAGYNHSAIRDLEAVSPPTAKTEYLMAIALSRMGRLKDAGKAYLRSIGQDPSMVFRANLDPELSEIIGNMPK